MPSLAPVYTAQNCRPAYQLNWSYGLFWRQPPLNAEWLAELQGLTETDGIRILQHRFRQPHVSQFLVSTRPDVAPVMIATRFKGRLQHLIRDELPKAFKRNYSLRSVGSTNRERLEAYLAGQLGHHRMADPQVQSKLERYQISRPEFDLARPRYTSHAQFL